MANRGVTLFGVPPGTSWELVIDQKPGRNPPTGWLQLLPGHRRQLTDRELRAFALTLTADPQGIDGPNWTTYLLAQRFLDLVPFQPRFTPREMAALVDQEIDLGWPLGEARQRVADAQGRTLFAVAQAHRRYGRRVARKPKKAARKAR